MISLSDVGMGFGSQVLFEGVNWRLQPGAHYGLVGANGSGKSTLLRLMTGELRPEAGTLSRPNELAIGSLGQDHFQYDDARPLDVVIGGKPRLQAVLHERATLLARMEAGPPAEADGHRLALLETELADLGGYEAEARAGTLLGGLGLAEPRHVRPMRELSGGYRLRVLLARTLFAEPGLLLLDEPTNHLDIDSIRWLEGYLRAFPGTFVVVSHDRHFLNAVCDQIADVDYQEVRLYRGDYDAFEAAKALAVEQKDAEIARAEDKIAEAERFIERFKAKATKARQAQSRKKQIERMELPEIRRSSRRYPAFGFQQRRPSGREALTVQGIRKAYGAHVVLGGVDFALERGERMAVVGPNGIGKSTLLKILAGQLAPDAGSAQLGYEVHLGYFAQDHHEVLRGRTSVYEWLHAVGPGESVGTIRGLLGRVLFSGDDVDKSVADLSGGEAARLLLAGLMLRRDNLLLLDEPTNHLDLEGREALMQALGNYEGTLIFVSHDRHFVSTVARRVLVLSPTGVEDVHETYEDYLAAQEAAAGPAPARNRTGAAGRGAADRGGDAAPPGGATAGAGYHARKDRKRALGKLRRQVERLEAEVHALERTQAELEARFAADGYYQDTEWAQVQADQERAQDVQTRLSAALGEWEAAAAELERLQEAS